MCITLCLWKNSREVRSPLVYRHPRVKTGLFAFVISILLFSLILSIIYSRAHSNYWNVHPMAVSILIQPGLFLLYALLISFLAIVISTIFFRFFIVVAAAVALIQISMPLLVLLFLCHMLWHFHVFYIIAALVTAEISILFFYFYEGYRKLMLDELDAREDAVIAYQMARV